MKRLFTITSIALFFASSIIAQTSTTVTTTTTTTTTSTLTVPSTPSYFGQGSNMLSLGIGFGGVYNYWGFGYTESPNIILSYDNGTFGHVGPGLISLGGLLSYKSVGYDFSSGPYYYNQSWSYWIIAFRSAFHWNFTNSQRCDPYIGLMLGYYFLGYHFSSNDPAVNAPGDPYYATYYNATYNGYLAFSAYLGFRYFVTDKIGFWAEIGYGYSNLAFGASYKF